MKRFYFLFILFLFAAVDLQADDVREILLTTQSQVYKYQYVYNTDNQLVMELELLSEGSEWKNSSRVARSYTDELLTLETHDKWNGSDWVVLSSMEFQYSGEQLKSTVETQYSSADPSQVLSIITTQYSNVAGEPRPVSVSTQTSETSLVSYKYHTAAASGEIDMITVFDGEITTSPANTICRISFNRTSSQETAQLERYSPGKGWQPQLRYTSFLNDVTRKETYQTVEVYKQTPVGMSWVPLQAANFDVMSDGAEALTARSWLQLAWNPMARFEKHYDQTMSLSSWSWQQSIYNKWREMARVEYDSVSKLLTAETQLSFWGRDMRKEMLFVCDFLSQNNFSLKQGERMEVIYGEKIYTSLSSLKNSLTLAYPNPTEGELYISSQEQITSCRLYDLSGKTVISRQPNACQVVLNLSELRGGVYILQTTSGAGTECTKIIKSE